MIVLKINKHAEDNRITNTAISVLSMVGLLSLAACQGGDVKINTDYSALQKSTVSDKPLKTPSSNAFSTYIKNGLRLRLTQNSYPEVLAVNDAGASSGTASTFSTTNVHEIGVDEGDRLKYDGEYLYTVAYAGYLEPSTSQADRNYVDKNYIRILSANSETASVEEVARILAESDDVSVTDLYLRADEDQLISVAQTQFYAWDALLVDGDWRWNSGKTQIQLYDVSSPSAPSEQWNIEIEGNLEGSRRVGNRLYLVTRYIPNIATINYAAATLEEKEANEKTILDTPISDLLPHYQSNNGAIRSLVSATDCLVAQDTASSDGYADIVTLTALDLDNQTVMSSVCLNANVQGIYSSTSGFYIGGTSTEQWLDHSNLTAIHKFDLNGGNIQYKASAALPGALGWQDPSFRMSEAGDELRVITTDNRGINFEPNHQLSILRDNGTNQLELIGSLPNDNRPAPIGKPGEDIFSVRFANDRAYIITFERVDPLYVIDLQNSNDPIIAGELEIPGFSRYLHPINQNWLLGIGHQVKDGLQQGIKLELYNVADIEAPMVENTLIFGERGSSTEVLYDLRSVTTLQMDENNQRLTIPMDIWNANSNGNLEWTESGLFAFNLSNINTGVTELSKSGKLIAEFRDESVNQPQTYPLSNGIGRSQLHDDAVYYLHGNDILTSLWSELETESANQ